MSSPAGEGFHIASAFVEITGDRSKLDREIDNLPNTTRTSTERAGKGMGDKLVDGMQKGVRDGVRRKLDPEMDRSGRGLGDKVSQGMSMALVRNSPLILAAIAAGLTAGAPLMLAASTTLFAGVGIVAAAQSQQVQTAWLGAWQQIRDGAISEAQVLVPTLVGAADDIAAGFQRMSPLIGDAFTAVAPLIDTVVESVIEFGENALPGMVNGLEESGAAIDGLGDMIASLGTGFGDFFDILGDNSSQSGAVFRELGASMEELLPLLAELLNVGVDVAASMLPLLTGGLGALRGVLQVIEPLIPAIAQGFIAWKVMQTASGWVDNLGNRLQTTAAKGGMFSGALGAAGAGALAAGPAVGALAAVVALVGMKFAEDSSNADRWARAMMEGGTAARQAADETKSSILGMSAAWVDTVDEWVGSVPIIGQAWDLFTTSSEEAAEDTEEAQRRIRESMSESERAAQDVTLRTNELNDAVDRYGPGSRQAADAASALAAAQSKAAGMAEDQEKAIRGVTEAMIAMVDQSRAMVDANFANEDALLAVEDATKAYADAVKEHGANSREAQDAMRELQRSYRDAGAAAAELAQSGLPAAVDDQTRAYFGARAELDYYQSLIAQGIDLPEWMDQHVAILERQVGGAASAAAAQDVLRTAIEELGVAVTEVPGEKAVVITGEGTEDLRQKLADLGFAIERIPGTTDYKIIADDADSEAALTNLMAELGIVDTTTAEPSVELQGTEQFYTDIAQMESDMLGLLGISPVTPEVDLESDVETQTDADLNDLFGLGGTTVEPSADMQTDVPETTATDLGLLGNLGAQTPTPTASLNDNPLAATVLGDLGLLGNLGRQNPTPTASLADSPLRGVYAQDMGLLNSLGLQRPTPTAGLNDFASGPLRAIRSLIDGLYSKTVTMTTIQKTIRQVEGPTGLWMGGNVGKAVRGFAPGGSPRRRQDGLLTGPGGPMDDMIQAVTDTGELIRVANREWIVRGASADRYGDDKMAAVNAGTATVLLPGEVEEGMRRFARGGGVSPQLADLFSRIGGQRDAVSSGPREVNVHVTGTFDFSRRDGIRSFAVELRRVLAEIEREER